MGAIQDKAKGKTTRTAEIDGDPVRVRVYSNRVYREMIAKFKTGTDKETADLLSRQFLDESGVPCFTSEFLLSDECSLAFVNELAELFIDVNTGMYKKKQ